MEPMVQAVHAEEMTTGRILDIAALRKALNHYIQE